MGKGRLLAVLAGVLVALGVALGVVQARKGRKGRRRGGADAPGRVPTVRESVLPAARDPEEVVNDLVPVMDERVVAARR